MNKQEVIKKVELLGEYERFVDEPISKNSVLNILSQIDESKKVKIPQFVAEWIEYCRSVGHDFLRAISAGNAQANKVDCWIYSNQDTFARAWLDGYEVEKEKRYRITIKNACHGALGFNSIQKHYSFYVTEVKAPGIKYEHTKEELEQAGFGWVFDCEGVKVEEVE